MNKGLQNCDAVAASPRKPSPIMNEMEAICKEANVADEALRSLMERLGPVMNLSSRLAATRRRPTSLPRPVNIWRI